MDAEEARTIGARLRQIRRARRKSLRVVAGLADISTTNLHRIETGQRALDSLAEIVALADALQIAPSELMRLPVPAPANGHTDSTVQAVDLALTAVIHDVPEGHVLPAQALRARVTATLDALCRCDREQEVGDTLPGLIQDLHASIAAGRHVAELLGLSALLHTQITVPWLSLSGASPDLRAQAVMLARHAAQERDTAASMGLVAAAGARVALAKGAFDIAQAVLDAVTVPTDTPQAMQLAGFLALRRSVVAAADRRISDVGAPLDHAGELAQRTGEGNAYGLGFGPINVDLYRISGLLEVGDHEEVVRIAEGMNPQRHANRSRQVAYWADYGQALARLRGRHEDAVWALRRAELISPHRIQRNPIVREVLGELLTRTRRDSPAGVELRRMAYRAGLPGIAQPG
ncbi:MAG: helix-turn-helix domain-containing protein [Pseudonocardiaceae bacterium]